MWFWNSPHVHSPSCEVWSALLTLNFRNTVQYITPGLCLQHHQPVHVGNKIYRKMLPFDADYASSFTPLLTFENRFECQGKKDLHLMDMKQNVVKKHDFSIFWAPHISVRSVTCIKSPHPSINWSRYFATRVIFTKGDNFGAGNQIIRVLCSLQISKQQWYSVDKMHSQIPSHVPPMVNGQLCHTKSLNCLKCFCLCLCQKSQTFHQQFWEKRGEFYNLQSSMSSSLSLSLYLCTCLSLSSSWIYHVSSHFW